MMITHISTLCPTVRVGNCNAQAEPIRSMEEILAEAREWNFWSKRDSVIFPWSQEEQQRHEEEKRREAEIDAAWQKARTETVVFMICKCVGVDAGGQVQAAIDADDEKQLVKLLQDFKGTHASVGSFALPQGNILPSTKGSWGPDVPGILPAEKVEKAQRRLC